jgi:signal transduction histidine kinase
MHKKMEVSLSTLSHELKNPLTLIYSTLQLIGHHYPEVTKDPLWPQLLWDVNYMSQLLSELSSLNSSQTINYSPINIRQFLTEITASFYPSTQSENKKLLLNFETDIQIFYGDEVKVREVFVNLIKNAEEATESGDEIVIDVQSRWNCLVVTVSDSGAGIDAGRLSTIFDPFVTYKAKGTGLGLTIVKNIVGAHGGSVQVYSKLGTGTKFVLFFPLKGPERTKAT